MVIEVEVKECAEIMAATGMMPDPQERMQAFVEKRVPRLSEPQRVQADRNGSAG